ncbi:MAG TPA: hypothetical protein VMW19_18335 [Myxococcota bacterium]|nr:hypothetical protein [Myxococcota bacterium]
MTRARAAAAVALCAALASALAFASQAPVRIEPSAEAAIRLSWRARGQPVEECRTPSPEEQAKLPVHMRQSRICERQLAPFHLEVALDGAPVIDSQVAPEGARHDRPAYVLRELRVAPGTHRLSVRFAPEVEGTASLQTLDAPLELADREVALVTEDPETGRLVLRRGPAP